MKQSKYKRATIALAISTAFAFSLSACNDEDNHSDNGGAKGPESKLAWMTDEIINAQNNASTDEEKEAVANRRAKLLIAEMSLAQKFQQLTGSHPEILHELPDCYGGRHVSAIPELAIPTFRITNGPVGVGQNDCVATSVLDDVQAGISRPTAALTHPTSAEATALPSAIAVGASFDPEVASSFGNVIATEMNNLALHVFEAPGVNLARIPVLGRNFEYYGEDPYLTGTMAVAEIKAIQSQGLIGMAKHFVGNEQESNRDAIQTTIPPQTLRELYLLPFEMAVKDGKVASIMCAYNYVNGAQSCENQELLTGVLREDWGFTGYVQSDFYAVKSTVASMVAGLDHEMPIPLYWSPENLQEAIDKGEITTDLIDRALERRYTQTFKYGIFDRSLVQTPIDYEANGKDAREIGGESAVLLQNNGALPFSRNANKIVVIGKATQVYAQQAVAGGARVGIVIAGGSSDVMPHYQVAPIEGIVNVLKSLGNTSAQVKLVLVDDENTTASIDGEEGRSFSEVQDLVANADAVVVMAGTIAEEGADRMSAADGSSLRTTTVPLAPGASAADGMSLDWYVEGSLTAPAEVSRVRNSNTVAMIQSLMTVTSMTEKSMAQKTALVLKDNASVAVDPSLVGDAGPSILEVWFPGQEDGHIVADLLFGIKNPSGKLPVTFPYAGKSFLDHVSERQFPGEVFGSEPTDQEVEYSEGLNIGYRWYDANVSGECAEIDGMNPCVAFPFGYGESYSEFDISNASVTSGDQGQTYTITTTVQNNGLVEGAEVVQVYITLPASAGAVGVEQPPKRLVGYRKAVLKPGESTEVAITVDPKASNHPLSIWNETDSQWTTPQGEHLVFVGNSSATRDLVQAGVINITQ